MESLLSDLSPEFDLSSLKCYLPAKILITPPYVVGMEFPIPDGVDCIV